MVKVLIADKMHPIAERILESRGIDVDVQVGLNTQELADLIGDYDGLGVRSATKVGAGILARADKLKVIGRAGTGVDNIDVPTATRQGVVVMNTPHGNAVTTAELAIALLLALARRIPQANSTTHAGKWQKSRYMGIEVTGKTLGIIGCGNIGSVVAERALGLRMKVIAFDPFLTPDRAAELGVERTDIEALYRRSDFITLHTPITDQTRDMIDETAIGKMKTGVLLINCARGGLIVESDLKRAIEAGDVAGAALDVFEEEPARRNILFGNEQVIVTPHLGASTSEAQEKVAEQMAGQMADFLLTGIVANAVNLPSIGPEEALRLQPYRRLAEQLGRFAGQVMESAIKSVTIEYSGHAASVDTRQLTATVLSGLLSPFMESVNTVNAPMAARDRGIDVSQAVRERATGYQTLIRLVVRSEEQCFRVSGTLFDTEPLIADIQGVPLDAALAPNMLFLESTDRPGVIGAIGTFLGDAGINISSFHLGRRTAGGAASSLIEIDETPAADIVAALQDLPQVARVRSLRF